MSTPFAALANLCERLEGTTKRLELADSVAQFLLKLAPEEVPAGVRLIIGQVFPEWDGRALDLSWKAVARMVDGLTEATPAQREAIFAQAVDGGQAVQLLLEGARIGPPQGPPLSVLDVYRAFEEIAAAAGRGSRARKEALLRALLLRATPLEAKYIVKNVLAEMRHGVGEGIMLEAVARAAGVKTALVRRANQLWGDLGEVAAVALAEGEAGLRRASVRLFRPLKPMLAQTAEDLTEAFERYEGRVALEYKLDGARVQIHKRGDEIRIYSRQLSDVTKSLPEVAEEVRRGLRAEEAILEGEAIAVDAQGRPLPFQHLMRRFRRVHDVAAMAKEVPVQLYLFDLLYLDGRSLVDLPEHERWQALESVAGPLRLVPRMLPRTVEEGRRFAEAAYRHGHEGVMAKDLASRYTPGVRGRSWLKLKHALSLDLVIVAADWGHGRRHGWLSNYHLAVRDEETGRYLVVGKTFKGLTDEEFEEMTARLLALERFRRGGTVFVEPRVVVEVLFNEIQESAQYKSGLALRFARIARVRDDKRPTEADTLQTLRQLYERQFEYKGKLG
ncbi:MAG TPA: ATP-dependent DNA ligase [Anaerolineae bacterium]|nr:ATP-dependent DNA ligase [Anaerolineae bacterium]